MTHEEQLLGLLKEGSDPNPATSTDTKDETKSTVGVTHQYDEPEDRKKDEPDALQGEHDGHDTSSRSDAVHHGSGTWEEHKKVRDQLLDRSLDSKSTADKADQAMMAQNFEHVSSGNFESHSTHLQPKSKLKLSHQRSPTLMERVTKLAGRH